MKRSNLDEMQELKLLKIEHNGCWLAFWGLLAALLVQMVLGAEGRQLVGEWLVFMALAAYLSAACMRAGIWDRRLKMNWKTNLLFSISPALVVALIQYVVSLRRYGKPEGALAAACFVCGIIFVLCFLAITLAAHFTKKRQQKLNEEPEE